MPPPNKCRAKTVDGRPCRVSADRIQPNGYCWSHDPANREELVANARKGGKASKKKAAMMGLDDAELPPLNSPEQAERWLEIIGRAVATNRLGHHEGRTITGAVRDWLKAFEAGRLKQQIEDGLRKIREFEEGQREDEGEEWKRGE